MKCKLIIIAGLMLAVTTGYSALLNVDFESDTVGNEPSGYVSTGASGTGASITVVDSTANVAGTGNGLQLIDQEGTSDYFRFGYEFASTGVSYVRASMDISRVGSGTGDNWDFALYDAGGITGSHTARLAMFRFYNNGKVETVDNGGRLEVGTMATNQSYNVTMYANDGDTAIIGYDGGTNNLAADSVHFYIDGTYVDGGQLRVKTDTDPLNTTAAITTLGFESTGGSTDLNYVVDNIEVIPEPATLGMIGVGGLLALIVRRRLSS